MRRDSGAPPEEGTPKDLYGGAPPNYPTRRLPVVGGRVGFSSFGQELEAALEGAGAVDPRLARADLVDPIGVAETPHHGEPAADLRVERPDNIGVGVDSLVDTGVMARSRGGEHRHRQPWYEIVCPDCGLLVKCRNTLPGLGPHIRAHFRDDGSLCTGGEAIDQPKQRDDLPLGDRS